MAVTSDDRNGVVVNRAIDSTRGIPNCLAEERCIDAKSSAEIHAKSECFTALVRYVVRVPVCPKSGFLRSFTAMEYRVLEQKINFYVPEEQASLSNESDGS